MSSAAANKKTKSTRKARTDVSSLSSSSESESDSPASEAGQSHKSQRESSTSVAENSAHSESAARSKANEEEALVTQQSRTMSPEQAFDDFYLKQVTREFASDLEKLRSASDFNDRSVPVLIEALRQGKACFKVEERRKIGQAGMVMTGGEGSQ